MKLIVCGPRTMSDYEFAKSRLHYFLRSTPINMITIFSGACDDAKSGILTFTRPNGEKVYGADGLGERYAMEFGIPVKLFPADWDQFGKPAGPIRNNEMAKKATHCLAFHQQIISRGTDDMLKAARRHRLIIRQVEY